MSESSNDPKPVDMDAIAARMGVSKTTVHYALRNTGRVSAAMRKKILKVAEEVGYRPNALARSLRIRKTHTVGVVLNSLNSTFQAHLLEGIDGMAQTHGYAMILSCTNGLAEKEKSLIEMLLEKGVDGLIVAPADPEANREYYTLLLSQGVKLVFVDREVAGLNIDVVSTDNSMGGYLAARHLLERGRKRFVFVSTTSRDRRSTSVRERLAGAASAISEAGFPAAHVVGPDCPDLPVDEEFAYQAFRSYLKRKHSPFDAVFAVHDGLAYGAIRALSEVRLSVPNEVAVAGFDDQDPSAFFQPPLTTVRQPVNEIGGEAIRLLLNRFSKKNGIGTRQRVALQPKLIVRGST